MIFTKVVIITSLLVIFAIGLYATPDAFAQSNSTDTTQTNSTDTTPPVVTVPDDINLSTTNSIGWISNLDYSWDSSGPQATDNVGVTSFSCNFPSGNVYTIGTTTVTCTASDGAGNQTTESFNVTVDYMVSDNIAPVFTSFIGGTFAQPLGWDTDPDTRTDHRFIEAYAGTHTHSNTMTPLPEQFLLAEDSSGYDYSFHLNAVDGFYHWSYSLAEYDNQGFRNNSSEPLTGLSCSGLSGLQASGPGGGSHALQSKWNGTFPIGTTTITCTATDVTGNVATISFDVTVTDASPEPEPPAIPADTVPPQILVPDDIVIETYTQGGASATFNPQAIDNIDELLTPTCNYTTGSVFPVGTTTVTCTATDAAGNTGIGTFAIIVTYTPPPDTTPPTISMLSDISDSTSDQNGKIITFTVTASDDVGVTSGPTCSPFSGSIFPVGTTTVTCTATDAAGNTNSRSFNVTIEFTGFSIPDWIKNVAGFWHVGDINDDSFLGAIEYLIENNTIVVPTTESGSGGGTVPSWVKNTAGWWANDEIDDETFVNALQFLIQAGLIQV